MKTECPVENSGFQLPNEENVDMNKKVKGNYEKLAQSTGLRFDEQSGLLYGYRNGFSFMLYALNENAPYSLTAAVSARRGGEPLSKEECKQFVKEHKKVVSLVQNGYVITMALANTGNQEKLKETLDDGLNAMINFLRTNGFENCCQTCGNPGETETVVAGNAYMQLCPDCFARMQQTQALDSGQKKRRKENLLGGIVGALIGSLLGVACIVILGQLGYVAALSGLVMAVCTMKGYDLLGGKLSMKGILIGVVLMGIMTYAGNQLDWAITVAREFEVDIATAYRAVPLLMEEEVIEAGAYWGNLALVYVFLLLGAVPTVRSIIKNQKDEELFYRLG